LEVIFKTTKTEAFKKKSSSSESSTTSLPPPPKKTRKKPTPTKKEVTTAAIVTTTAEDAFVAKYVFEATQSTELSLDVGDVVYVRQRKDEWWRVRCHLARDVELNS
jgi:hypothetical protein